MPHGYKFGTNLRPHIHFVQTSSSVPTFKISYKWYDIGDPVPGSFTTITSTGSVAVPYVSGSIHNLLLFPEISVAGIGSVSSILDLKVYREDNVVTGDVLVKEFDIHYRFDTLGSLQEATK